MDGDFCVGQWLVQPKLNCISGKGRTAHVEPKAMQVLVYLAEHAGDVMPKERIIQAVWADTFVTDDVLTRCISELRKAFEDDPHEPRFIQTIPKGGYRLIAPVEPVAPVSPPAISAMGTSPLQNVGAGLAPPSGAQQAAPLHKRWAVVAAAGVLVIVVALLALNVAGLRDRLLSLVGASVSRWMPPPRIESIAVLPLENLSRDPEQEYFADGMTDELITNLGKISALRVISRQSTMRYKGSKKPLPEIARELNVDAVVEGTVLRSGDRVRITANLLHAPTDRHLWAESYERDLRDVLALQGEVAQAVVGEIRIKLTPQEQTRVARARQVKPAAYDAYLRARHHWERWTGDGVVRSMEYLQQAIAEDPAYAPAHAALAQIYFLRAFHYVPIGRAEAFSKARTEALKAVELDDTLAEAHTSLGIVRQAVEHDLLRAEREFKRALELNPGDDNAHRWYGQYLIGKGEQEKALSELQRAWELDPLSPDKAVMVAWPYELTRQYDKQIYYIQKALELDPNFALAHHNLALVYVHQRKYREALQEAQKAIDLGMNDTLTLSVLASAYAGLGQRTKALKLLAKFEEEWKRDRFPAAWVAELHLELGNKEQALAWLEKAYRARERRFALANELKVAPEWDPLRSDPRFQDLLRRMNFPR